MTEPVRSIATRVGPRLLADPNRVVTRLFLPGDDVPGHPSRTDEVLDRVLAFDEATVAEVLRDVLDRYGPRHAELAKEFAEHFDVVSSRLAPEAEISDQRKQLIGACLTHEFAVEGAALTNPSMVEAPDQSGLEPGELRFILSVRCIGEAISSIGFRTGVVGPGGRIRVDDPAPKVRCGHPDRVPYPRSSLIQQTSAARDDEVATYLLNALPESVTDQDLEQAIAGLPHRLAVRQHSQETVGQIRSLASCNYGIEFPPGLTPDQKILWPNGRSELHGMEDARFVRFTSDDGAVRYQGTYTAFDGFDAVSQLITTEDFETFRVVRLAGAAAGAKGLALFPRPVNGLRYAMCRPDNESFSVAVSEDGIRWDEAEKILDPGLAWDLIQTGNCGSPIETAEGWLLITHGVGPMREYRIGALLLDLKDPTVVRARLTDPLLAPEPEERDGYVANVVYSCGSLIHDGTLVLPYGFADRGIDFATVRLTDLLERLL